MEEKALIGYGHGHKVMDSLEDKVSMFFHEEFADESHDHHSLDDEDEDEDEDDDYESGNSNSHDHMERALYWESEEALLQEILERYGITGSKLRQEVRRIIGVAKETGFCNCLQPNSDGCTACLRQRVVGLLNQKGFNATLCTSKWKHTKNCLGGKHEYVEMTVSTIGSKNQILFVIEMEFRDQFEIAKACDEYRKLVVQLPEFYIGKADHLNAIVGILCDAAKRSMKEKKIHMGPWRKRSFMQKKWSSSSERGQHSADDSSRETSVPSFGKAHESCLHFSAVPAVTVT